MSRHEKVLLVLAAVLLVAAIGIVFWLGRPQSSSYDGTGIPWSILLWQFGQQLAPPLALIGLASAVGILFLRAVHWKPRSAAVAETAAPESMAARRVEIGR